MGLTLDTHFIVTAEREARRGCPGRVDAFLKTHATDALHITFTVAGELACGTSAGEHRAWEQLCRPYPMLPWSPLKSPGATAKSTVPWLHGDC